MVPCIDCSLWIFAGALRPRLPSIAISQVIGDNGLRCSLEALERSDNSSRRFSIRPTHSGAPSQ